MYLGHEGPREEGSPESGTNLHLLSSLGPSLAVGVRGEGQGSQTYMDTAPQTTNFQGQACVLGNRGAKSGVKSPPRRGL